MCPPPIFFILPTPPLSPVLRFFSSSPAGPYPLPTAPSELLSRSPPPSSSLPSPASLPSSSPPVRAAAACSRAAAGLGLRMCGGTRRVTAGGHGRGGACLAPTHRRPFSPASLPDLRRRWLAACVQRWWERQARGERGGGGSGEIRRGAVRIELREVRCPSPLLLTFHNCP